VSFEQHDEILTDLDKELNKLITQRIQLIGYLSIKVAQRDWHDVVHAAMDIQEVEAKHTVLLNVKERK
jgi:hypothetical protein